MTFCLAVTVLFLWVWHHQTQFNDHYRKAAFLMRNGEAEQAIEAYQKAIKNKTRTIFFCERTFRLQQPRTGRICMPKNTPRRSPTLKKRLKWHPI